MDTTTAPLYEVKLYLGSVESDGEPITRTLDKGWLISKIGAFQENYEGTTVPVRVTDTTFVSDDYTEDGWEVAAISYPRTNHTHKQTLDFMLALGGHLLGVFGQSRICVLDLKSQHEMFGRVYMLENENGS